MDESFKKALSSNDSALIRAKLKELIDITESLEYEVKCQKFSILSVSASLSKLMSYLEDDHFDKGNWIRFLLTTLYHNFKFKSDKDYLDGANYIKSKVELYPTKTSDI